MDKQAKELNNFLVTVFNDILRLEETNLRTGSCKNLSVSELHVLEAIHKTGEFGAPMAEIAERLGITASTLTTAVKTLESKGYLCREKDANDKRRTFVKTTQNALAPLQQHERFHTQLVQSAAQKLTAEEINTLCTALQGLHTFFATI